MARMSKMDYQMHCRMQEMLCLNESRHKAKQEYKEMTGENKSNRTIGIHSYKTYNAYKQTSIEFIRYIRQESKEIKDISAIKEEHVIDYLKHRQDDGKTAHTISKDMAALNKLFNFKVTKADAGIKERSYKDITRSRDVREHDFKYNPDNYKEQITIAKSCGCRRESVLKIKPDDFLWKDGLPFSVHLTEKGGKERDATLLEEYRSLVKEILEDKDKGTPIFEKYTRKIDNHAFRREYAQNRYKELAEEKGFDAKDYRGYDREVLGKLTRDLGHNRLDVVIYNYLK